MILRRISGKDSDYQFIQVIGSGGFGTVSKVRRVKDGKIMACKSIDCSTHPELEMLASREIEAWASFGKEKNIATFSNDASWNASTEMIRIYMDFYEGGDLQGVIDICQHEETLIHPIVATYWAVEIARAIKACHDHGIIHRDIKPPNILLNMPYVYNDILWSTSKTEVNSLTIKDQELGKQFLEWMNDRKPWCHLTDFGLGKFSTGAMVSRNTIASYGMVGTPGYIAPESMGESPVFSSKSDIYSLGCLLYALCKSKPLPSLGLSGTVTLSISDQYPKKLHDIITRCLHSSPSMRPTSREVVNELNEAFVDAVTSRLWTTAKTAFEASEKKDPAKFNAKALSPEEQESERTKLLKAIRMGDVFGVRMALAEGTDANGHEYADGRGDSFLEVAARQGEVRVVEALLDHGARLVHGVDAFSAFRCAVSMHHNEVAKLFFNRGLVTIDSRDKYRGLPIHDAAGWGNLEMVQWLMKRGASIRAKGGYNMFPIHEAAKAQAYTSPDAPKVVNFLLKKDPESIHLRDREGNTTLHHAAASNNEETIMLVYDAGGDPFAKNKKGETPRNYGSSTGWHLFDQLEKRYKRT